MGSFITSTSVTVPNWPKYSRSRSWFVCQLRPPTNSFPGAESELGVLRPLDSPCKMEALKYFPLTSFLDFFFLCLSKVVSCSPNHFLQLVKFEPQELPVPTQLNFHFIKERKLNYFYYSSFVLNIFFVVLFSDLPGIRYHLKRAGAGAARRAGPSSAWNDKMISAPNCQGSQF